MISSQFMFVNVNNYTKFIDKYMKDKKRRNNTSNNMHVVLTYAYFNIARQLFTRIMHPFYTYITLANF